MVEKITLKTDYGNIPCALDVPDDARAIVIVTHGFDSSMASPMAQLLLARLPEHSLGAIIYDQPGHGTAGAEETELTVENCIGFLKEVEAYAVERFMFPRIFYFASSYGAYVNIRYLLSQPHLGDKSFLRSAAVNMPGLFAGDPDPAVIKMLDEQGYILMPGNGPHPLKVPRRFFEEMLTGDLFAIASGTGDISAQETNADIQFIRDGIAAGTELAMIHGECDEVIDPAAAKKFADAFGVPLTMMAGEDHTLSTDPATPDNVLERALAFFAS